MTLVHLCLLCLAIAGEFTPSLIQSLIRLQAESTTGIRLHRQPWDYELRDDASVPDKYTESLYSEEYDTNFALYGSSSILPFLRTHFKACPMDFPAENCRPFYMPCKSELACAVSCRVNEFACGKCSETNSFRKVCQCCISDKMSQSMIQGI